MEEGYNVEWQEFGILSVCVCLELHTYEVFKTWDVIFFSGTMSDLQNTFVTSGTKEMIIILNVHKKKKKKKPKYAW